MELLPDRHISNARLSGEASEFRHSLKAPIESCDRC